MDRLTKRTSNGIAYMAIADTLTKAEQEIEGSKPILEGLYAMFQKLADFEDAESQEKQIDNKKFSTLMYWLTKEVAKYDFSDFLDEIGLTLDEYHEIKDYLRTKYGVKTYC